MTNDGEKKIIVGFLIITMLFAILFCYLEYKNQIRTMYFSLEQFQNTDREEIATIIDISKTEKYYKIEGQLLTDIKSYKLDIGIEESDGKIGMHKTQYDNPNNRFYTLIPKRDIIRRKYNLYCLYV